MAKIYISYSIQKEIGREKRLLLELIKEIKKHNKGNTNLVDIYSPAKDLKILKAYLLSKKVRAAILLKISKNLYIPLLIAKKESIYGWNISKYSEEFLYKRILKIQEDIQQHRFIEYEI